MFIYKITNKINNKIYIGKTIYAIEKRWKKHIYNAFIEKRVSYFYTALRKYGPENFEIKIIEKVKEEKSLNQREVYWIKHFKSQIKTIGYNMTSGGDGGKMPLETIKKIADSRRGIPLTEAHKEKLRKSLKGRKRLPMTEVQKKLISKTLKEKGIKPVLNPTKGKFGNKHHFYGKHHTKKTRMIISQKAKGRPKTQSQKDASRLFFLKNNPRKKNIPKEKIIKAFKKHSNYRVVAKHLGLTYQGLIYKIKTIWNVNSITEFVCIYVKKITKQMVLASIKDLNLTTPKLKAQSLGLTIQAFIILLKSLKLKI